MRCPRMGWRRLLPRTSPRGAPSSIARGRRHASHACRATAPAAHGASQTPAFSALRSCRFARERTSFAPLAPARMRTAIAHPLQHIEITIFLAAPCPATFPSRTNRKLILCCYACGQKKPEGARGFHQHRGVRPPRAYRAYDRGRPRLDVRRLRPLARAARRCRRVPDPRRERRAALRLTGAVRALDGLVRVRRLRLCVDLG